MKFINLMKADTRAEEIIEKFKNELRTFQDKYPEYKFYLEFPDKAHLVVVLDNVDDYCEDIHDDLCHTFDVNLQYVSWVQQQNVKGYTKTIELIYTPVHHYTTYLKWDDVKLKTNIDFQ